MANAIRGRPRPPNAVDKLASRSKDPRRSDRARGGGPGSRGVTALAGRRGGLCKFGRWRKRSRRANWLNPQNRRTCPGGSSGCSMSSGCSRRWCCCWSFSSTRLTCTVGGHSRDVPRYLRRLLRGGHLHQHDPRAGPVCNGRRSYSSPSIRSRSRCSSTRAAGSPPASRRCWCCRRARPPRSSGRDSRSPRPGSRWRCCTRRSTPVFRALAATRISWSRASPARACSRSRSSRSQSPTGPRERSARAAEGSRSCQPERAQRVHRPAPAREHSRGRCRGPHPPVNETASRLLHGRRCTAGALLGEVSPRLLYLLEVVAP